jgi:hypothetical protein
MPGGVEETDPSDDDEVVHDRAGTVKLASTRRRTPRKGAAKDGSSDGDHERGYETQRWSS